MVFLWIQNLVVDLGISCFYRKLGIPWAPQKVWLSCFPLGLKSHRHLSAAQPNFLLLKPVPGAMFSSINQYVPETASSPSVTALLPWLLFQGGRQEFCFFVLPLYFILPKNAGPSVQAGSLPSVLA